MSNPFSTRFIRPGAIPFIFSEGQSLALLLQQLEHQSWRGQIIGPHGSGKSTLLASLTPALEAAGRQVICITLQQSQRKLPTIDRSSLSPRTQLVIDGYEQLGWWSRRRLKSLCANTGAGLLVTAHGDAGLPCLYETRPTPELAQQVVRQLAADNENHVTSADVASAFRATQGNIRETLFRLYDVYQANDRRP